MMTAISPTETRSLRDEARRYGVELNLVQALALLKRVGDHNICIDALLMKERPAWLATILSGPAKTS